MRRVLATATAVLSVLLAAGCGGSDDGTEPTSSAAAATPAPKLGPCRTQPGVPGFRCGTIEVPKYRSDPGRGSFEIGFAVRKRNDADQPSQGAIFAVEGGPGYASTTTAATYQNLFRGLLDHRDLVLVDMRGTGLSGPIDCPNVQRGTAPEWIGLGECARRLGDDFEAYATGAAAEDIDAVRAALGYERMALYGDSYGTFLGQSYAYRHPDRLEAVVLDGAYPVQGESPWYPSLIRSGNRNFVTACDRSPSCPPGAGERLRRQAQVMRDRGMNPGTLIDAIAGAAYGPPQSYLDVESAGRALLNGDDQPWIDLNANLRVAYSHPHRYDYATELVVGCNDYPMIWDKSASEPDRRAQLEDAIDAHDPDAFRPFTPREVALGSTVGYLECLTWPQPTDLYEPPVPDGAEPTDAPVLVVNGEFDDLTTPREGATVAAEFPNSQRFIGRNAGHVDALYNASGPSARTIRRFLREQLGGG
ncbi:MAG: alpha/beta fold hydrolase [Solirubrobacterales bacterium]